jgi:hypothetical protein
LPGIYIVDEDILKRYKEIYPEEDLSENVMHENLVKLENASDLNKIYYSHI